MKRAGLLVLAGALLATTFASADPTRQRDASFPSQAIGETLHYVVYLPAGYDTSGLRYPVVYFLHGLPSSATAYRGVGFVEHALDGTGTRRFSSRRRALATASPIRSTSTTAPATGGRRRSRASCRASSTRGTAPSALATHARSSACPRAGSARCISRSPTSASSPRSSRGAGTSIPRIRAGRRRSTSVGGERGTCTGSSRPSRARLARLPTYIAFYVGQRRLPLRGRERAAEPGARAGPGPARLPLLPGRARPGALGTIRRRLALARAGSSRTAPVDRALRSGHGDDGEDDGARPPRLPGDRRAPRRRGAGDPGHRARSSCATASSRRSASGSSRASCRGSS